MAVYIEEAKLEARYIINTVVLEEYFKEVYFPYICRGELE